MSPWRAAPRAGRRGNRAAVQSSGAEPIKRRRISLHHRASPGVRPAQANNFPFRGIDGRPSSPRAARDPAGYTENS